MNSRSTVVTALATLTALWLVLAYATTAPPDYSAYHRTLMQVAETVHDATQTGRLLAEQELAGRVTGAFAETAFADATEAVAGAQKKFAVQGPPDAKSVALRDELAPMLAEAVLALGDTAEADGDGTLRSGVRTLEALTGRLDAFIEAHG